MLEIERLGKLEEGTNSTAMLEIEQIDELKDETKSTPCEENKVETVCESDCKKGADDDEDDEDDAIWNLSRIYNANEIRSVCPALCDIMDAK